MIPLNVFDRFNLNTRALAAACAAFALTICAACKSDYPASTQQNLVSNAGAPRQVKVARVAEIPVGASVTVTGTLAAQDQATLSVKVPGRLGVVSVDLGSVVHKGQTVAQVEQQDYKLRVEQADASLQQARVRLGLAPKGNDDDQVKLEETGTVRQARAVLDQESDNLKRVSALVEQGVVPRVEYDTALANFKVAQGKYQDAVEEVRNRQGILAQRRTELALAQQALADTTVVAPFDGVVQEKKASVGEYLAAAAPVVTIVRVNPLRFRGEVPEREAESVRAGQPVRVTVEGDARLYAGRIVRLSPVINQQNRVLIVEADIANPGSLRPGGFAHAEIVTDSGGTAITVPPSAVVTFAGIEKVITVEDGKAKEKPVTTGRRADTWTEVLSGVGVGEPVVVDPGNLQSGQAVNVVE
jgi:RND family efflux transporter MFP subunit